MSKIFAFVALAFAAVAFSPVHAADSEQMKALKAEIKAEKKAIKDAEKLLAKMAELAEIRKQREAIGAPAPVVPPVATDKAPTVKRMSADL